MRWHWEDWIILFLGVVYVVGSAAIIYAASRGLGPNHETTVRQLHRECETSCKESGAAHWSWSERDGCSCLGDL